MPVRLPGPGVNVAPLPEGKPERSAMRLVIGSPSGSTTDTPTVIGWSFATVIASGALITGGRSPVGNSQTSTSSTRNDSELATGASTILRSSREPAVVAG